MTLEWNFAPQIIAFFYRANKSHIRINSHQKNIFKMILEAKYAHMNSQMMLDHFLFKTYTVYTSST